MGGVMKKIKSGFTAREAVVTGLAVVAALLASGRIFLLLHREGSLYTMGLFPLALLLGIYCLWKKALFMREVFFAVWVRAALAAVFTAFQVTGLRWSHPGLEAGVSGLEILVWILCLTPLSFAGQNMLFSLAVHCADRGGHKKAAGGKVLGKLDAWFMGRFVWAQKEFSPKRGFLYAFLVIMLGFLIPLAAYYPAIMAYDVIPQLDQIRSSGYTTHHPLIHTLMLTMSLKIGEILPFVSNADRAGLAVYSLLQMTVVSCCFSYVYTFLRRKGVNRYLCYLFVLCAAFYPTHGLLAVSITKDTIYAVLVMVFAVSVWEIVTWRGEVSPGKGWLAAYTVLTVLLLLFRNNSIYAWVFYVIVTLFMFRGKLFRPDAKRGGGSSVNSAGNCFFYRDLCISHGIAFLAYMFLNTLMIQASGATSDTYAREMLSVPAQQIARVAAFHEEELTVQDRENLSVIWDQGELPEYVPAIADRSKRDIEGDREVLKTFAREWVSLGCRYPGEYWKAFLLKNKGMWYLEDTTYLNDVYSYAKGYLQLSYPSDQQAYMEALVPGYVRHQKLQFLQSVYRYFAAGDEVWRYLPPFALVMQPAFYCWALLFYCLCCIGLKRPVLLVPAVYTIALVGTLLLGPCVLTRYLYPVMLSVTVLGILAFLGDDRDYRES